VPLLPTFGIFIGAGAGVGAGLALTFGIGFAAHTRFNASLNGIAGVWSSDFFLGAVMSDPSYGLTKLYEAIGLIVTQWSFIEQSLDTCVALIYHSPGGRAMDTQLPASTLRKATLIKKGLKNLPHLSIHSVAGHALIQRVMDTKDDRHHLVHSVLTSPHHKDGVYSYVGLKVTGDFHVVRPWKFDLKTLPALQQKLEGLATDLMVFSRILLEDYKAQTAPPRPPGAPVQKKSPKRKAR
jgi:hypothetical protein